MELPAALLRLSAQLARLPGVGQRSALRLAFHVLSDGADNADALARALLDLHSAVRFCARCRHLAGREQGDALCSICADPRRDEGSICVVESVPDLLAIERSAAFRGTYHVLHGVLSPLRGVGPIELDLDGLVARVDAEKPSELVLAVPVSVEGEATASYIQRLVQRPGLQLSRIASGVPQGAELEYLDEATLGRALQARQPMRASAQR